MHKFFDELTKAEQSRIHKRIQRLSDRIQALEADRSSLTMKQEEKLYDLRTERRELVDYIGL